MSAVLETTRFGSGKEVARVEDPALLAGKGQFTDDVAPAGQLHVVFARSPHAHARIVSIDTASALAVPGVVAVFTGADLAQAGVKPMPTVVPFKRPDGSDVVSAPRRALAHEKVRFVGEPVAMVVAESRHAAQAGVEALMVDYEELPSVTDTAGALRPGAPKVVDGLPDNIAAVARHGDAAATDAAFKKAAVRVAVDIVNQRVAPTPIEPRTVLADFDGKRLTIRLSSQMPSGVRTSVCDAMGLNPDDVRVVVGDVGGGFGMKTGAYPEDLAMAYAARALKRPLKWRAERLEEFLSAVHGRDVVSHAEMALDASGKVLAVRVKAVGNTGAYATGTGILIPLVIGPWVTTSIYDIPLIDLDLTAVMTHTNVIGAYRGAGRPEAIYQIERLMDAAARELQLDPAELRRRNMIQPNQFPYTNPMQQVYDCGEFEKILDQGLKLADWNGFAARRAASERRGLLRGRGIATFLEWTSGMAYEERVTVTVTPDGMIEVCSAVQQMGQGIATSLAQLAVDVFQVPIDRIRVVMGDTDRNNGFGSAGSRSLYIGGSAVHVASKKTIDEARTLAAEALEAPAADIEYKAGRFSVTGTDLGIGLFELAGKQKDERIFVDANNTVGGPSWPNSCHVCEVEIDPDTGKVDVVAYASVNDIGRVVSPQIARGQVEGGAVQGIGQALCEKVSYDAETGQALSATFMDYAMPRVDGFLHFKTEFDTSVPGKSNVLGAKGVGELGTIGATPAVVNAVIDALDHAGQGRKAEQVQMPLTAERVWRALHGDYDPAPLKD
ncbi:MAG: xanthine dehydrogenase family protein molybdopterin-binding subunit [Burkholderiaceae bacterium]|nr:xanthine dehydrogenase family protein molybdopterin-binding subunit [Burkholderiaceae bacterium]